MIKASGEQLADLPFPPEEYRERRDRVRAAMTARGIDLLYVTSPANLFYLTGYEAIWYPGRLPLGAVIDRRGPDVTFFDWTRHEAYVSTRVLCDEVIYMEYGAASARVAETFARRGWLALTVGVEWHSFTPAAPILRDVTQLLEQGGARIVAGDWIVDRVRLYKSPAEVERVRRAARIADEALLELSRELRPGMSELAVSARLAELLALGGSEIAAMQPLVNSGPAAWASTHGFPTRRMLQHGDVVAVDCCAVVDRYHVNLARTFAIGSVNPRAAELLELASGSVLEFQRQARVGEEPDAAAAAADRFVRERIASDCIWWVGGYALGISFAPSWVGHTYLANDGVEKCRLLPGYVSNFENVLFDRAEGFEAAYIDTLLVTQERVEILSSIPRGLLLCAA